MRKTKWVPLTFFEYGGNVYCILARLNKKTGMIYFKQKRFNGMFALMYKHPNLDIDYQFKILLEATE
jgi:hypothetical protein